MLTTACSFIVWITIKKLILHPRTEFLNQCNNSIYGSPCHQRLCNNCTCQTSPGGKRCLCWFFFPIEDVHDYGRQNTVEMPSPIHMNILSWLGTRLWYLYSKHNGNTTVLHQVIKTFYSVHIIEGPYMTLIIIFTELDVKQFMLIQIRIHNQSHDAVKCERCHIFSSIIYALNIGECVVKAMCELNRALFLREYHTCSEIQYSTEILFGIILEFSQDEASTPVPIAL